MSHELGLGPYQYHRPELHLVLKVKVRKLQLNSRKGLPSGVISRVAVPLNKDLMIRLSSIEARTLAEDRCRFKHQLKVRGELWW